MKLSVAFFVILATDVVSGQHSDYQPHYLVGLLNYPNSFVPDVLQNHTSGTSLGEEYGPYSDVPGVGFSDIEFYYDEDGNKVLGEYYCLSDNGKSNICTH